MNYFEEPSPPLFLNKSQIKFFTGHNLTTLEESVSAFMLSVRKIYNVKHFVISHGRDFLDVHYVMVSYE